MPGDPDPRRHLSLSTDRMVALSDGVFGFAMTLLVVDIAVRPPGTPLEQFLHAWPAYVAYVGELPDDRGYVAAPHRVN